MFLIVFAFAFYKNQSLIVLFIILFAYWGRGNLLIMAVAAVKFPTILAGMHAVGCVDLMHQNLLVRLFYPTHVKGQDVEYAQWLPSTVYAEGFIDMVNTLLPSMPLPAINKLMSELSNSTNNSQCNELL